MEPVCRLFRQILRASQTPALLDVKTLCNLCYKAHIRVKNFEMQNAFKSRKQILLACVLSHELLHALLSSRSENVCSWLELLQRPWWKVSNSESRFQRRTWLFWWRQLCRISAMEISISHHTILITSSRPAKRYHTAHLNGTRSRTEAANKCHVKILCRKRQSLCLGGK